MTSKRRIETGLTDVLDGNMSSRIALVDREFLESQETTVRP